MAQPSKYELLAWEDIQRFRARPLTRALHVVGDKTADGARALATRASEFTDGHPRLRGTQDVVARGFTKVTHGASAVRDAVPEAMRKQMGEWGKQAVDSVSRMLARAARLGLSPKRVIARHQSLGHQVTTLADIRTLDLEQVDAARGRGLAWYYPAAAALSGAGAGFVITGSEGVIAVTGGAAAAPGAGTILGTMAVDTTVVLGLASRTVGHVALYYGYDPEVPAEKLFVMAVVNAGTALSGAAKTRAMAEVSRLTQQLFRGAATTWKVLNESLIARVSTQFGKAFGVRVTKQTLGKVVPVVGVVLGAGFNWTTLESIVDAADVAYRRRFLLDKYPELASQEAAPIVEGSIADEHDEEISIFDELVEAGGPDLRVDGGTDGGRTADARDDEDARS